ncbi:hypothetical protein BJ085DRAFT_41212, partial [Dimargaris cristalligena]
MLSAGLVGLFLLGSVCGAPATGPTLPNTNYPDYFSPNNAQVDYTGYTFGQSMAPTSGFVPQYPSSATSPAQSLGDSYPIASQAGPTSTSSGSNSPGSWVSGMPYSQYYSGHYNQIPTTAGPQYSSTNPIGTPLYNTDSNDYVAPLSPEESSRIMETLLTSLHLVSLMN